MDWFDSGWGLTLAIFLPAAGMVIVLAIPKAQEQAIKIVTLLTTLATLAAGVGLLVRFDYDTTGGLQFEANKTWIDVIQSRYHIGIDGIALPLLLLSMIITVGCVIYSWNHFPEPHNPKGFLALTLLLEAGMNGTFAAQDLILFFIFFE
ncbi:MAG: NADH-quinone oxidoreductase subunit M, partial [Acidimicrobiia bacterium]